MLIGSRWICRSAGDADVLAAGDRISSTSSSPQDESVRQADKGLLDPPKKVCVNARKVNAATNTMPAPVIQTASGYVFHAPIRMVISAANPLNPGMPIDAAEAITKTKAAKGSARLSSISDSSSRSRV